MKLQNEMLVVSAKLEDKLYNEMGITGDEISMSVQKLMHARDEDFIALFQK